MNLHSQRNEKYLVNYKRRTVWKNNKKSQAYLPWSFWWNKWACVHGQVHKNSGRNRCTLSEVFCHLKRELKKKKKTSNNRCYNAVSYDTTGSFGSPGERKGAHLSCAEILEKDWSWFSAVLHTECFTQSRSPINACGIELTELHWKEKRTQGIGDFKSLLQEGQFQVETKILNLWICLLGTGDIYILKGEQITNIRIGTA